MISEMTPDKAFENKVLELLRLVGYNAQQETLVGSKKVDLLFEIRVLTGVIRIAVECKYYSSVLHKNDIEKIFSSYYGLKTSNLIDQVLIITMVGLAPAANAYIKENQNFLAHLTFDQLQSQIMDFAPYLKGLVDRFDESPVSKYYVPMNEEHEDKLLEDEILNNWVNDENSQPLAILGGYGLGKTTLATKLSYELAKKVLYADSSSRIPIIIRLGEISNEQSLEGLLGKLFTTTNVVKNYTFDAFMSLNKAGRFVVILDGFDEMKHNVNWENFRYNFDQLNRLHPGNSKVILLGRPTAFLSDFEHQYILHRGRDGDMNNNLSKIALLSEDMHDYQEVKLAYLTRDQIKIFLSKYLDYLFSKKEISTLDKSYYEKELEENVIYNIAKRPVQLKMLIDVLPQIKQQLSSLTLAILYDSFIDFIIKREYDKVTRLRYTIKQRRKFARELAWYLWLNNDKNISAEQIPIELLANYKMDKNDEIEAIRRDLVSACFLERKIGESLYFPHRSFQEFLVAEEIYTQLKNSQITLEQITGYANPEIYAFLNEMIGINDAHIYDNLFRNFFGKISINLALILAKNEYLKNHIIEKARTTNVPWYILLFTIEGENLNDPKTVGKILFHNLWKFNGDYRYTYMILYCAAITQDEEYFGPILLEFVSNQLDINRPYILHIASQMDFDRKNRIVFLKKVYQVLIAELSGYCYINEWGPKIHHRPGGRSYPMNQLKFTDPAQFGKLTAVASS